MADDDGAKKKKRSVFLNRDIVMRRLHLKQQGKKASPMTLLKDIFEETDDKDRFVGDIMFWKYFEDIDIDRIYHTNSVEYRNLKVMFFETVSTFSSWHRSPYMLTSCSHKMSSRDASSSSTTGRDATPAETANFRRWKI